MDAQQYRTALATLALTQKAAGEWLGVSEKTAKRYATTGPSGPAARAIEMRVESEGKSALQKAMHALHDLAQSTDAPIGTNVFRWAEEQHKLYWKGPQNAS